MGNHQPIGDTAALYDVWTYCAGTMAAPLSIRGDRMKRLLLAAVVGGFVLLLIPAVGAQTVHVSTPLDGLHGAPGSTQPLSSTAVDAADVGQTCSVTVNATNNKSVHIGNELIVTSDGTSLTLPNVEDEEFLPSTKIGTLVLGTTLDTAVKLGVDGVSSVDVTVSTDCQPAVTTTPSTTIPPSTTTTAEQVQQPTVPLFTG